MATDIHCILEARVDKQWKEVHMLSMKGDKVPIYNDRDYRLFGLLSSIREVSNNPLAQNRGIPDDVSNETLKSYNADKDYCFGYSWISGYELYNCKSKILQQLKCNIQYVLKANSIYTDNYRVIFWYDC